MLVAGVQLPAVAVADLIGRLDRVGDTQLAARMGLAFDANRSEILLDRRDRAAILHALSSDEPSFALRVFRDALLEELR